MEAAESPLYVRLVGSGKFSVQSRGLICSRCGNRANAHNHAVGDACAKCGVDGGVLKQVEHLVAPMDYNGVGSCTCEHWTFTIQPKLNRMSPDERRSARGREDLRCDHIRATLKFMAEWGNLKSLPVLNENGVDEQSADPCEVTCPRCGVRFTPLMPEIPSNIAPELVAALRRLTQRGAVCPHCVTTTRAGRKNSPERTSKLAISPAKATQNYRQPYPD